MATYDYDKLRETSTRLITKFGNEINVTNKSYLYDKYGNKDGTTDTSFVVQGVFVDTHNILIQSATSVTIDDSSEIVNLDSLFYDFGAGNFPQQFELNMNLTPDVDGVTYDNADFILFATINIDGYLSDNDSNAVTDNAGNFVYVE